VTDVQDKIAGLMRADVEFYPLLKRINGSLPVTMTIDQESVTISAAATASAGSSSGSSAGGLDTSGRPQIGNMTISGTARSLTDLPLFVDRLAALPGVVDVVPTSNTSDDTGMSYSVSLSLTDKVLSHRFDAPGKGGN
jgi:hypothetical protein